MNALKLTKIGNSVGIVLPKELLVRLRADVGDTIYLTESPDGIRFSPYTPEFEKQMGVAENVMKKRRSVLRALAE